MLTGTEQIHGGWSVYGNDGSKIGTVYEAGPDYLLVDTGFLQTHHLRVPASAIKGFENDMVFLNVPENGVEKLGWEDQVPFPEPIEARDNEPFSGEGQAPERVVRSVTVKPGEVEAVGEDEAEGTGSKTERGS